MALNNTYSEIPNPVRTGVTFEETAKTGLVNHNMDKVIYVDPLDLITGVADRLSGHSEMHSDKEFQSITLGVLNSLLHRQGFGINSVISCVVMPRVFIDSPVPSRVMQAIWEWVNEELGIMPIGLASPLIAA